MSLDQTGPGLRVLFESRWICRQAVGQAQFSPSLDWRGVDTAEGLWRWEAAWNETPAGEAPIFPPSLLAEPRTVVVAGLASGGVIHAGGIAHDAAGVVGLSNLFGG